MPVKKLELGALVALMNWLSQSQLAAEELHACEDHAIRAQSNSMIIIAIHDVIIPPQQCAVGQQYCQRDDCRKSPMVAFCFAQALKCYKHLQGRTVAPFETAEEGALLELIQGGSIIEVPAWRGTGLKSWCNRVIACTNVMKGRGRDKARKGCTSNILRSTDVNDDLPN
ncbi:hypothetical protein FRC08_002194, partial [Ceratobasidium sp. 394]